MIGEKLYLTHPHHWVPLAFNLSRLMHWFLDAARIQGTGRTRQMEEIGITAIFLGALAVWARDDTPALERTRRFLRRRLDRADRLMALGWRLSARRARPAGGGGGAGGDERDGAADPSIRPSRR